MPARPTASVQWAWLSLFHSESRTWDLPTRTRLKWQAHPWGAQAGSQPSQLLRSICPGLLTASAKALRTRSLFFSASYPGPLVLEFRAHPTQEDHSSRFRALRHLQRVHMELWQMGHTRGRGRQATQWGEAGRRWGAWRAGHTRGRGRPAMGGTDRHPRGPWQTGDRGLQMSTPLPHPCPQTTDSPVPGPGDPCSLFTVLG